MEQTGELSKTCCFIGHRSINETEELRIRLYDLIEKLIECEKVNTFLFGSGSRFNGLCHELVTEAREKYPHIKRIYVRAEYPFIHDDYRNYLLRSYEDTYFPEKIIGAGRAVYIERNYDMIRKSDFCVIYYHESCSPAKRKSGTKIALDYAIRLKKQIVRI